MAVDLMERMPSALKPDVAGWLAGGTAFAAAGPIDRIDTHAACIVLQGERAWKIKRPVDLGYLDFSTPEKRHAALVAELCLNRRTAPDLYIAVHPVMRRPDGTLAIGGAGEPIDWVLEMKRFPPGAVLDEMLACGQVDDASLAELADAIVAFHRDAEVCRDRHGAQRLRAVIESNARAMAKFPQILPAERAERLTSTLLARVEREAELLDARAGAGRVRHGHGDLHLANIAVIDDRPVLFDCLEFDTSLATTDVLYDLGFLLMDLCERGWSHAANIVFNRYLDRSACDETGSGLLPLFMAVRACIRAHVLATQAGHSSDGGKAGLRAIGYLGFAERMMVPEPVRLIAIGGLSGTGKSTLARALGGRVGGGPGARILRSDVLRKRLAGVEPEVHLPDSCYTTGFGERVYAEMNTLTARILRSGHSVIVDAVFTRPQERYTMADVALRAACRFDGLWLQVDTKERLKRVEERGIDASDADGDVVRAQAALEGMAPRTWGCLKATRDRELVRAAAAIMLDLKACDGAA
jgi:aminoglycoside phosphotransferase family enzyme/predicted kinase